VIYLDNNSTTQPLPEVVEAMRETQSRFWANPSSSHSLGKQARACLEEYRSQIAQALGTEEPARIIFTSSGTESINLACSALLSPDIEQIITCSTDHYAVHAAAKRHAGTRPIKQLPVDSNGRPDIRLLEQWLSEAPSLLSIGYVNNETGVINELAPILACAKKHNTVVHLDAIQAVGKIPISFDVIAALGCHAISVASHKFHGPKGLGILYLKSLSHNSTSLCPGHQEHGLRGGTENLPAIAGAASACHHLHDILKGMPTVGYLRDQLEKKLLDSIPNSAIHGASSLRIPNTISLFIPYKNASDMIHLLSSKSIYLSAGAACSNAGTPSHVIQAMDFSMEHANSTIRISLSGMTTDEDIKQAFTLITEANTLILPSYK